MDDYEKTVAESDNHTLRLSRLNRNELWNEIQEPWLVKKTPISKHFFKSVQLQGTQKERRDYFFAAKEKLDFYWIQATFNERDKKVREMIANNSEITESRIIAKLKKARLDEYSEFLKQEALDIPARRIERKRFENQVRKANSTLHGDWKWGLGLVIVIMLLVRACLAPTPDESPFIKACKYGQMKSDASCQETQKRNRKFEKELDKLR
jgi:hypothetical protein|tara:strand:- start:98 stop:724 length:627 start_codon:yes stop_codon:yes gene_type:complete